MCSCDLTPPSTLDIDTILDENIPEQNSTITICKRGPISCNNPPDNLYFSSFEFYFAILAYLYTHRLIIVHSDTDNVRGYGVSLGVVRSKVRINVRCVHNKLRATMGLLVVHSQSWYETLIVTSQTYLSLAKEFASK